MAANKGATRYFSDIEQFCVDSLDVWERIPDSCCVVLFHATSEKDPDLSFHTFPSDTRLKRLGFVVYKGMITLLRRYAASTFWTVVITC